MGEAAFALLCVGLIFASFMVWMIGTFWVFFAIFKPQKVAENAKAKRTLVIYFINAALCGVAYHFPDAAGTVLNVVRTALVASAPYAEGSVALLLVILIRLSPVIVVGFIVWLLLDALSGGRAGGNNSK